MNRDEILDAIRDILVENFRAERDRVTTTSSFVRDLRLDSLDVVDFVFFVHKRFGYKAPLHDYRTLDTVQDLVAFIEARLAEKSA